MSVCHSSDGATASIFCTSSWVKISRSGNTFTSYYSTNGKTWTKIGSAKFTLPRTVYFGLAVCAHNNSLVNTSTFSNVSVSAKL